MTRQLLTALVRLFAICLVLWAGKEGLNLHLAQLSASSMLMITLWVSTVVVPCALAIVFWQYPQALWITTPLRPQNKQGSNPNSASSISIEQLLVLGIALIGMWLLASGLPRLATMIVLHLHSAQNGLSSVIESSGHLHLVAPVVQLLVALMMVFGARRLAQRIARWNGLGG